MRECEGEGTRVRQWGSSGSNGTPYFTALNDIFVNYYDDGMMWILYQCTHSNQNYEYFINSKKWLPARFG